MINNHEKFCTKLFVSDLIDVCDVLSIVIIPKFRTEDKRFCAESDHRQYCLVYFVVYCIYIVGVTLLDRAIFHTMFDVSF